MRYRIKTEKEFLKRYGNNWKSIVMHHWTS